MIYLIDSCIIIDHLRGDSVATNFLLDVETGRIQASISVITEYELLSVPRMTPIQSRQIAKLLSLMPSLAVTSRVARCAADFHRTYRTHVADALIAATASIRNATLVTRNIKDFKPIKKLRIHSI